MPIKLPKREALLRDNMHKNPKRLYPETIIVFRDFGRRLRCNESELRAFNTKDEAPHPKHGDAPVYLAIYQLMEIRKLTAHVEDELAENPREPEPPEVL